MYLALIDLSLYILVTIRC